ncbi:hypothetical protein K438DRAFT_1775219 [Mycena galopus ATCC 62051]|nr:hypothetical protein K438DRAFT_1775219 [Mycena galopus ATCC 62051]
MLEIYEICHFAVQRPHRPSTSGDGRDFDGRRLEKPSRCCPVEKLLKPLAERVSYPLYGTRRTGATGTACSPKEDAGLHSDLSDELLHAEARLMHNLVLDSLNIFDDKLPERTSQDPTRLQDTAKVLQLAILQQDRKTANPEMVFTRSLVRLWLEALILKIEKLVGITRFCLDFLALRPCELVWWLCHKVTRPERPQDFCQMADGDGTEQNELLASEDFNVNHPACALEKILVRDGTEQNELLASEDFNVNHPAFKWSRMCCTKYTEKVLGVRVSSITGAEECYINLEVTFGAAAPEYLGQTGSPSIDLSGSVGTNIM